MIVSADYYMRMGSTHTTCQDYCLAGRMGSISYGLLSDGCSGKASMEHPGSPYTDFGSRFLVMAGMTQIKGMSEGFLVSGDIAMQAWYSAKHVGLPNPAEAIDGTFLAVASDDASPYIYTYRRGDGVIVVRHRDGTVHFSCLEYQDNKPYYLSYYISESRETRYLSEVTKVTEHLGTRDPVTKEWKLSTKESEPNRSENDIWAKDRIDLVLMMSDGAESFIQEGKATVELPKVLDQILDIKGYAGEFIKRRCNRFMTKFCPENSWQHFDDFSITGLYFPPT